MTAEPDATTAPAVEPVDACPLCGGSERQQLLPAVDGIGVVRCRSCGLVHATGHDDHDAGRAAPPTSASQPAARVQLYDRLSGGRIGRPRAGARALDIGCASGLLLDVLRELGYRTEGIERAPAGDQAQGAGHKVHALDIEITELKLGRYELITLIHVLEHLREPVRALVWIRRHLAPGGLAVIEVSNWGDLLRPLWGRRFRPLEGGRPISFFERSTLSAALARAGLELEILWSAPQVGTALAPSLLTVADMALELRRRLQRQHTTAGVSGPRSPGTRQGRGSLGIAAPRVVRGLDRLDDVLGPWLEGVFGPGCGWGANLIAVAKAPG